MAKTADGSHLVIRNMCKVMKSEAKSKYLLYIQLRMNVKNGRKSFMVDAQIEFYLGFYYPFTGR